MCTLLFSAKPHASHRTDGFVPATFEVGHDPIWIPHECSIVEGETTDRTTPGEKILVSESAMLMLPEPQGDSPVPTLLSTYLLNCSLLIQ